MKKKMLKTILCLSLSAAMLLGETGAVLATTAPVEATTEAAEKTEETTEVEVTTEETTEVEATTEAATEVEVTTEVATEVEADTEETTEVEASTETTTEAEASTEETTEVEATTEETEETIDSVGAKIVSAYNLANVEGLAYDAQTRTLSWNKVKGADLYKIEVYDADGKLVRTRQTSDVYYIVSDYWDDEDDYYKSDATYTFKVTAKNTLELYQVAADVEGYYDDVWNETTQSWDAGIYSRTTNKLLYRESVDYDAYVTKTVQTTNGTVRTYTLYKRPASVNAATISAVVKTSNSKYVTALSGITVKETTDYTVTFKVTPNTLQKGEYIQYKYSNNPEFKEDAEKDWFVYSDTTSDTDDIEIYFSEFVAGDTIYVKANVYNPYYDYTAVAGQTYENRKSQEVTATYKVPAAQVDGVTMTVTKDSIRLVPYGSGTVTGYQYQRKNGKKWVNLAQQGDNYTDAGLKADTKYTYRVRGYIYNSKTGKTTYTDWKTVSATTWGAALNLKASAASATSVKLTWSKVSGADGYEIYRVDTASSGYNVKNGEATEYFDNSTLIKTIKKAKTVKYTDKKLTKGNSYTYMVRAYRTVGKTKCYIDDTAYVTLFAKGMNVTAQYYNAKAQYVVKWNKMTGISGYKVEKYDDATGTYVKYKTLKKSATSVTLPKVAVGGKTVKYRIRPYKGSKYYNGTETITVYPKLAAVKGVKAVQTAEGVQVSWKAVAGADYYRVFRAKKDSLSYNETTKTYSLDSSTSVYEVNYQDTSAGVNLAPVGTPTTYQPYGSTNKYVGYKYDVAVSNAVTDDGKFYDELTAYETDEIKGTSVVDKTVTVPSLVSKSEDPTYNKDTDPEYVKEWGYCPGEFGNYQKNADGSLKTKNVTLYKGPQVGTEYYYFVVAYTDASNGAGQNDTTTVSMGCTKAAKIVYTNVKAAKATKVSSAKSSKKATATIKVKKVSGAKGYAIYRSTKKNGKYVQIGTTTTTSYTDNNVVGGKTYYYKVASYKKSENGTFIYSKLSAAKKVKVKK